MLKGHALTERQIISVKSAVPGTFRRDKKVREQYSLDLNRVKSLMAVDSHV